MMPLWIDLYEGDEDDDSIWNEFCDGCLEPLAVCNCGLSYDDELETNEDQTDY